MNEREKENRKMFWFGRWFCFHPIKTTEMNETFIIHLLLFIDIVSQQETMISKCNIAIQ